LLHQVGTSHHLSIVPPWHEVVYYGTKVITVKFL